MLLSRHALRKVGRLPRNGLGVDCVRCEVVGHDVVVRVARDAQGAGAQHARAVLAVLAVHERGASLGGDGAQHCADEGIVACIAAVVVAHALLGGTVFADDAMHETRVGVALFAPVARLHCQHANAGKGGLGVCRDLARPADVVDRLNIQHVYQRNCLLGRDIGQLARAEKHGVFQVVAAHRPQGHAAPHGGAALSACGQHVEGERLHGHGRLVCARQGPRTQLVAARRLGRVGEVPAQPQFGARAVAREVCPGGPHVKRELHRGHAVLEVIHIALEADGLAHVVEPSG